MGLWRDKQQTDRQTDTAARLLPSSGACYRGRYRGRSGHRSELPVFSSYSVALEAGQASTGSFLLEEKGQLLLLTLSPPVESTAFPAGAMAPGGSSSHCYWNVTLATSRTSHRTRGDSHPFSGSQLLRVRVSPAGWDSFPQPYTPSWFHLNISSI